MKNNKGIFGEFLEEMKVSDSQSLLTRNDAAHPLFLMERENRLWEKKLEDLEERLIQVGEHRRWEDVLPHLEELEQLRDHYEKIEKLFSYAQPIPEQLYMQHLMRGEQEEILEMIAEIKKESFLLGKSTMEKSLFLEHLFLRIRQEISREETSLFEDLREFVRPQTWQTVYYELLDIGYLFPDVPEFFKEEGTFVSEDVTKEQLEAVLHALEIPLSVRGKDGRRLLRLGPFPMHDESNESALRCMEEASKEAWSTKLVTVKGQQIRYISLRNAHGEFIGLLEKMEEK